MDARDAAAAIRDATGLTADRIDPIGDGWTSWVFEVDGQRIFRFPRTDEVAAGVLAEARLLEALAEHPDFGIPAPQWSGTRDGRPFFGYEKIQGRPLVAADLDRVAGLDRRLADVVGRLHSFDADAARALLGVEGTVEAWRCQYEEVRAVADERITPLLTPAVGAMLARAFDSFLNAGFEFAPTLVHGDLGCGHILVGDDGSVGLIDFGEATVGDPAIDFVGFRITLGSARTRQLVALYPCLVDAGFVDRVEAYWWLGALQAVLYGLDQDDQTLIDDGLQGLSLRLGLGSGG